MSLFISLTTPDGETSELHVAGSNALIGRAAQCDVVVSGCACRARARQAARRDSGGVVIEDLGGMSGTVVNGVRVVRHGPLDFSDDIVIGGYKIRVRAKAATATAGAHATALEAPPPTAPSLPWIRRHDIPSPPPSDANRAEHFTWRKRIHGQLLDTIDLRRRDFTRMSDDEIRAETETVIREMMGPRVGVATRDRSRGADA